MSAKVRHRSIRRLAIACVAAAAMAAVGGEARGAAESSTFSDGAGDAGAAPDITDVAVSNDSAGAITIRVGVPNRPQLGADDVIMLWIDADRNEVTGPSGLDYRLLRFSLGAVLERWNGSGWSVMLPPGSFVAGWQTSQFYVAFNRADLGIGGGFRLSAAGLLASGDDPNAWLWDDAPDLGAWTYTLVFAPTLGPAKVQPARPRAGRVVSVSVPVQAGGAAVDGGTVKCSATVGGKQLRAAGNGLNGGMAGCSWRLPAGTAGKTLRGSVTVTTEGGAASRSFSAKVR